MKQFTLVFLLMALGSLLVTNDVQAQKFSSLDKSPMDVTSFPSRGANKVVKVIYSRPQLKGRQVYKLAKKGKIWRTGANEATEITFYQDVTIGGKAIKAGSYSLFTIPGDEEWTLVINSKLNQWGAYTYNKKSDVVRATGKVSENNKSVEAFSMKFDKNKNGADLIMGWGNVVVRFPIEF